VSDAGRGIRRVPARGGFAYVDVRGRPLRDEATLARIRKLAIPPAYTEVWICPDPRGHLQATGRDARGRKQYRYHPHWQTQRHTHKFDRVIAFGAALPQLRRRLREDLSLSGLPRQKVLALVVALLDATRCRIGNVEYARSNDSFGLTTLRTRHASIHGATLRLRFRGKGGLAHDLRVDNPQLARLLRQCQELPGQRLFQYLDADGHRRGIDSGSVNAYLRSVMGQPFSAKDFRTWSATLGALTRLATTPLPEPADARACAQEIKRIVSEVAADLRNTPAVCRSAYIHPVVFDCWIDGRLHDLLGSASLAGPRIESKALALLRAVTRNPQDRRSRAPSPRNGSKRAPRAGSGAGASSAAR
jgi:DNA topoisomerase I